MILAYLKTMIMKTRSDYAMFSTGLPENDDRYVLYGNFLFSYSRCRFLSKLFACVLSTINYVHFLVSCIVDLLGSEMDYSPACEPKFKLLLK